MFTSKPSTTAAGRSSLLLQLPDKNKQQVDTAGTKAVDEMLRYVAEVEGRVKTAVEDAARRTEKLKAEEQAQRSILGSLKKEIVLVQEQRKKEADHLERFVQHAAVERDKLREELSALQHQCHHEREQAEKITTASHQEQQTCEQHIKSYQLQAKQLGEDIRQLAALKKNAEMDLLLVEQLLCEATRNAMTLDTDMGASSNPPPAPYAVEQEEEDTLVCHKIAELAGELQETECLAARYLSSIKHQQQQHRATLYKMQEKTLAKREELNSLQHQVRELQNEVASRRFEKEQGYQICSSLKEDAICLEQVREHLLSEVHDLLCQRQALLVGNEAMSRDALSNVEEVVFQALQKSFSYREVFVELEEVKRSLLTAVHSLAEQKEDVEQAFLHTEAALAAKRDVLMAHHHYLSAQDEKLTSAIERAKDKESEVVQFVHDLDRQMREAQALAMAEAIQEAKHSIPPHE